MIHQRSVQTRFGPALLQKKKLAVRFGRFAVRGIAFPAVPEESVPVRGSGSVRYLSCVSSHSCGPSAMAEEGKLFSHTFLRLRTSGSLCNSQAASVVRAGRRLLAGACSRRASAGISCKAGGSSLRSAMAKARCAATRAVHQSGLSSAAHVGRRVGECLCYGWSKCCLASLVP